MKQLWVSLLGAITAFLAAGCSTTNPSSLASIRQGNVAVTISAPIPQRINLSQVGTTAFNNSQAEQSISVIGSTTLSEAFARDLLANGWAKRISPTTSAFAEAIEKVFPAGYPARSWNADLPETRDALRHCEGDFSLVVRTSSAPDQIFGTNQILRGVGVRQRGLIFSSDLSVSYATLSGFVFDCQSGALVQYEHGLAVTPTGLRLSKSNDLQLDTAQIEIAKPILERDVRDAASRLAQRLAAGKSSGDLGSR